MLGTVKMEGHESSDWNSYYADTQEVRGGRQAGKPGLAPQTHSSLQLQNYPFPWKLGI